MRLGLLALFLLAGCSVRPTGLAASLPGSVWLVDRIVETDGSVRRGTGETVAFGADGRIALSSCNECSGAYAVSPQGVLTLGAGVACTRRGCADGAVELERTMAGPLAMARDGEYLVLSASGGTPQVILLPDALVPDASAAPTVQPPAETN